MSFGTGRNLTRRNRRCQLSILSPWIGECLPYSRASALASKPRCTHTTGLPDRQTHDRTRRPCHSSMPHAAVQSQRSAMMASRPFSRLVDSSIESLIPVLQSKDVTRRSVPSRSTPIESISTLSPHRVGESPNASGHQSD
jgi:hypothetical protein